MAETYQPGDYVKVEFPDETTGIGEWMWVRVLRCDDQRRLVFGTLDNEPLADYGGKLKLGSELAVSYDKAPCYSLNATPLNAATPGAPDVATWVKAP